MARSTTRAGATAVAAALAFAPAAAGQFQIPFEPPEYTGSPAGEPLAGQDGWELVSGAADAWRVHTEAPGIPAPLHEEQFIAAGSASGPAALERATEGIERVGRLTVVMAVDASGGAAAGPEIGSWSLAPREESASFSLHAVWEDAAAPGAWRLEVGCYAADGSPQRIIIRGAEDLEPGRWYSVSFTLHSYRENHINDVWLREGHQYHQTRSYKPVDWYLAGGAAGGLPVPTAVRVESLLDGSADAVLATDGIFGGRTTYYTYSDCNRDGTLDFFDYLCYQNAFAAGAPWADCDGSGQLDFFDFLCFQNCFAC